MLTKEQLKQLKPFTKNKKYGQLLKAAIVTWKKCTPVYAMMGVVYDIENKKFKRSTEKTGCCLLGASICNRKSKNDEWNEEIIRKFKIKQTEYYELFSGFDNRPLFDSGEAYEFAQQVREIVNPEYGKFKNE